MFWSMCLKARKAVSIATFNNDQQWSYWNRVANWRLRCSLELHGGHHRLQMDVKMGGGRDVYR